MADQGDTAKPASTDIAVSRIVDRPPRREIGGMRGDAQGAPSEFHYFAGVSSELKGTTYEAPAGVVASSYREPFGVVGRIIPFNHPYRFCAKVSPIIAAGNSVILKPAEATSLSSFDFGEMTLGLFPPGVINVVSGLGATTGARFCGVKREHSMGRKGWGLG